MKETDIQIIDHTSDIGIKVQALSLEGLFINAAYGMFEIIGLKFLKKQKFENNIIEIKVEGLEQEDLLFSFLSEILYFFDGEHFLPQKFFNNKHNRNSFSTKISGIYFKPKEIKIETEIKAVTLHKMKIEKKNNYWQTLIIFDV